MPDLSTDHLPCRIELVQTSAALEQHRRAWDSLVDSAAEANVFYEPCCLLPLLRAFAEAVKPTVSVTVVLVWSDLEPGAPALWGLFPLERRPASDAAPPLRLFQHDYCYVPVPLVHCQHGPAVMRAFFAWLSLSEQRIAPAAGAPAYLAIDALPADGVVSGWLRAELTRRGGQIVVSQRWTRALLQPDCGGQTYRQRASAGKHRKEWRRQRQRLSERGPLSFDLLEPSDDVGRWLTEFLGLEASGWKGQAGSAIGSRLADARFFLELGRAAHAAGRLTGTAVRLGGRALAMQFLLRSGAGAVAFVLGYDEAFARFSPGVMLELDLIDRVADDRLAAWIDSAARPDHPMMNRLWTQRRTIESWQIRI